MRDPQRIDRVCALLKEAWAKYPDMRFGQLVVNLLGKDPYYVEDDETQRAFRRLVLQGWVGTPAPSATAAGPCSDEPHAHIEVIEEQDKVTGERRIIPVRRPCPSATAREAGAGERKARCREPWHGDADRNCVKAKGHDGEHKCGWVRWSTSAQAGGRK